MLATRTTAWDAEEARTAILSGTAPEGIEVKDTLTFDGEEELEQLPAGLKVQRLRLRNCPNLEALPASTKRWDAP